MKTQITKVEPKYIDVSTPEGPDFLLTHYEVHFRSIAPNPNNNLSKFEGVVNFLDIDTQENLIRKIKQRIIDILNEKD